MMKITAVELQKKNSHRFNIFLDGQFAFGADEDTLVNYRLLVGKEISPDDLSKILFETEVGLLMGRMYNLFSRRPRSEKEVRDYLKRLSFKRNIKNAQSLDESSGISELVVDSLIDRLKQKGMINDQQFAADWVESRRKSKKKGINAIKSELYQKGIDREIINDKLQIVNEESEQQLAKEALEKKVRLWKNLDRQEFKRKALEFLVRRGFSYDLAKDMVESYLKEVV